MYLSFPEPIFSCLQLNTIHDLELFLQITLPVHVAQNSHIKNMPTASVLEQHDSSGLTSKLPKLPECRIGSIFVASKYSSYRNPVTSVFMHPGFKDAQKHLVREYTEYCTAFPRGVAPTQAAYKYDDARCCYVSSTRVRFCNFEYGY